MQIVHSSRRGSRDIEHIGSAHDETQLALLKAVARQRLAAGQGELDLGLDDSPDAGGPLEITSSRMDTCGTRCAAGSTVSGSLRLPAVMRCSGSRLEPQITIGLLTDASEVFEIRLLLKRPGIDRPVTA